MELDLSVAIWMIQKNLIGRWHNKYWRIFKEPTIMAFVMIVEKYRSCGLTPIGQMMIEDDRKSITTHVFKSIASPIMWASKKQAIVVTSPSDALTKAIVEGINM